VPPLNWDIFEALPGAADTNFEKLCRALIKRQFGSYGDFVALAAQPGVEFHLRLHSRCSLGDPGRWFGWQCRWYELPAGRALGSTRRTKIAEAIATTEEVLPSLTDWILWTRRPLTSADQTWFYRLQTRMRLVLWTGADVEDNLTGDAAPLRATFFGELVLTPASLAAIHAQSVAPIRGRWLPEVHQPIRAERKLRRILGDTAGWDAMLEHGQQLYEDVRLAVNDTQGLPVDVAGDAARAETMGRTLAALLTDAHASLTRGDFDLLQQQLAAGLVPLPTTIATLPRRLRALAHPAALAIANELAGIRYARRLFEQLSADLSVRSIAVTADAGCGKTEMAAQLTAASSDRPAGLLLHGRELQARQNLDDLARHVVIQAEPVQTMPALLEAVNAAGQRANRRLPIVIDGLNEAEDPRDWRAPLASLTELLRQYPFVLVVCTLRGAFAPEALPSEMPTLEIPNFEGDTAQAIERYFAHYRIDAADAELPQELLSHPLTLRLFCEVTNPSRERVVGVEAMPESLTGLFDRYLDQAARRIADLAPRTSRYLEQDVRAALDQIGAAFWRDHARTLELGAVRTMLGDSQLWGESIVRALEQDGVLLRVPGLAPGTTHIAVVFDALAGHLVATAILAERGQSGLPRWLADPATRAALDLAAPGSHPLATDVFRALVGLVPRRHFRNQLWTLLDEPLRGEALREAANLEGAYLDADTMRELAALTRQAPSYGRDLFDRLWNTRGSSHPLNAAFLDAVLRDMDVAARDLRWTEWVRRHADAIQKDLENLASRWSRNLARSQGDELRARWIAWTMTSTVRELRDEATRALYWFGRGDPRALFRLTIDTLAINDLYVPERALAACYGVVMAHQLTPADLVGSLSEYLGRLRAALVGPNATAPTYHWLERMYVQGICIWTERFAPEALPAGLLADERVPFATGRAMTEIPEDDPRCDEVEAALGMDFENYTLGSLFEDRGNYDMDHAAYKVGVACVLGGIWDAGWRAASLGAIDRELGSYTDRGDRPTPERYGKKYGRTAFYTLAGSLRDAGRLSEERLTELQVDPSFPDVPDQAPVASPRWIRAVPVDDRRWIRSASVSIPDHILYAPDLGGTPGPWIAVHGDLSAKDAILGRQIVGSFTTLLIESRHVDALVEVLLRKDTDVWSVRDIPGDYYTFAGEIPWHPHFGSQADDPASLYQYSIRFGDGSHIDAEILAHTYAWEGYHSSLNRAGGALAPSRLFSSAFDLRGVPQSFMQALPDGARAAMSYGAPEDFMGHLLYLREDLVRQYAGSRVPIWFASGERRLLRQGRRAPEWLQTVYQSREYVWRQVRLVSDVSPLFARRARGTRSARSSRRGR
jgi:hypothetical protein